MDENYYKLLEDFTTLVDGEYHAQEAVKMVFPDENSAFGSIAELIREGLEEDAVVEGMRSERLGEICDRIERELGNANAAKKIPHGRAACSFRCANSKMGESSLMWRLSRSGLTICLRTSSKKPQRRQFRRNSLAK